MTIIDGTEVNWSLNPRLFWIPKTIDNVALQDYIDTARKVHEHNLMNLSQVNHIVDAAGKEELGGGQLVGITATNRNVQVAFDFDPTPTSAGSVTTPDSTGTVLYDDSATFEDDGVTPGAWIVNFSDVSISAVISVDSQKQITCIPLGGGTDNKWDNSDSYVIWNVTQKTILGGNLVAVDENEDDMGVVFPTPLTQVITTRSSSATLQDLEAIQYASYQNAVWIQPSATHAYAEVTYYPAGNREFPVNNLTDAVAIANEKGFNTLQILENMTLDSGTDITNFIVVGHSHVNTIITIDPSAVCNSITIDNCNVTGTLDGGTHILRCTVGDLNYVNGHIHQSGLYGTVVLSGDEEAVLEGCYTVDADNPPIIDMGGSGQDLAMFNYNGKITITNLSSDSEEIDAGLSSGTIILASSISAGTINIAGLGILVDNSTGTASVNSVGLLSLTTIADAVWDETASEHQEPDSTGELLGRAAAGGEGENQGSGSVTVYGTITNNQTDIVVDEVEVRAINPTTNQILVWNKTNTDGYFELFLDPGEYIFEFTKEGYLESETRLTIPDQALFEIPAVTFTPEVLGAGTGSETVTEVLIDSNADPIEGARCRAFIDGDMDTPIAQVMTDSSGRFTLYLDPETYVIECRHGDSLRYLRVIVELGSTDFTFEDITTDYVPPPPFTPELGRGTGTQHISDYVQDTENNRLKFIHVIVKILGTDEWIAEDWTNENGEFHLYLDVGSYNFFFSGPDFTDISARGDV